MSEAGSSEAADLARSLQRLSITMLETYKGSDAAAGRKSVKPPPANRRSQPARPSPRPNKPQQASKDRPPADKDQPQHGSEGPASETVRPRRTRHSVVSRGGARPAAPPSRKARGSDPGPHVRIILPLGAAAASEAAASGIQAVPLHGQPCHAKVSFAKERMASQESSTKSDTAGLPHQGSMVAVWPRHSSVLMAEGSAAARAGSRSSLLAHGSTASLRESVMALLGAREQLASIIAQGTPTIVPPSDRQPMMQVLEHPPSQRGGAREMAPVLRVLQKVPFLSDLEGNALVELCRWVRYQFLQAGQVVFSQGDLGALFYIIASGRVAVVAGGAQPASAAQAPSQGASGSGQQAQQPDRQMAGQGATQTVLEAGQTFGEKALTKAGVGRRNATVTTLTECELLTLDINQYTALLSRVLEEGLAAKVEVLRGFEVTAGWSESQLRNVASALSLRKFPADKVVLHQGAPSTSLFFVKSGEVRVVRHMPASKRLRHLLSNQTMAAQFQPDSRLRDRLKDTALKEGSASSGQRQSCGSAVELQRHLLPLKPGEAGQEDVYVEIATLGPNELFGEVGASEGKYRQASIVTNTYTELLELTRHDLLTRLKGTCRVTLEALSERFVPDEALLESLVKDVEWQRYKHRLIAGVLWESSHLGHMVDYTVDNEGEK